MKDYTKLGGWLLFYTVWLLISISSNVYAVWSYFISMYDILSSNHSDWELITPLISVAVHIIEIMLMVFIAIAILKKRQDGPKYIRKLLLVIMLVIIGEVIATIVIRIVGLGILLSVGAFFSALAGSASFLNPLGGIFLALYLLTTLGTVASTIAYTFIWRSYFLKSERVRVYFDIDKPYGEGLTGYNG